MSLITSNNNSQHKHQHTKKSNCAFKDVSGAPRYYAGYTARLCVRVFCAFVCVCVVLLPALLALPGRCVLHPLHSLTTHNPKKPLRK